MYRQTWYSLSQFRSWQALLSRDTSFYCCSISCVYCWTQEDFGLDWIPCTLHSQCHHSSSSQTKLKEVPKRTYHIQLTTATHISIYICLMHVYMSVYQFPISILHQCYLLVYLLLCRHTLYRYTGYLHYLHLDQSSKQLYKIKYDSDCLWNEGGLGSLHN